MTLRMLIDARHREETRVAVVKGNRIEEFDFESAEHKQLKGNIYLAKVTRVEPSLQAAFVDYGGNRHGFLAFSEIHPDYYQIPREDREALLAEEARHAAEEAALRAEADDDDDDDANGGDGVEEMARPAHDEDDDDHHDHRAEHDEVDSDGNGEADAPQRSGRGRRGGKNEQAADELRRQRMALRRRYKIQDVIKRRQVLLVQVVKEERGNKGAALTSYLSLAGRYCVLMPNTSHGGGISRKINNNADRKRLKAIIAEMALPSSMGCIVRTAGLSRTKPEIRRDFDYLARLWDEIRETTLRATAPALVHNDSDLIKRAIRDIYNREIEEVIVEGEDGYRAAKDFMKLLMPSHARRVKQYADAVSLFQRFGVEDQLAAMYHPVVQLKSGGYLVINPTEALVSIDINSGRSTREHNIEQTAYSTNIEAAREIARQLRLRDMAGLVVIDFIDMEHNSNIRKVEKAMKEALKDDRARIQVGRISGFGLMEMSRQRLRTGVLEASTRACPHCEGTGLVRTASSAGLSALRMLEEEAARGNGSLITLRASQEAAFYVLNNKRREIDEIESRYGVTVAILPDGEVEGARMSVEASGPRPTQVVSYAQIVGDADDDIPVLEDAEDDIEEEDEVDSASESEAAEPERAAGGAPESDAARKRRRRRRGRRGRRDGEGFEAGGEAASDEAGAVAEAVEEVDGGSEPEAQRDAGEESAPRKGRRGRRGGRGRRSGGDAAEAGGMPAEPELADAEAGEMAEAAVGDEPTFAPVIADTVTVEAVPVEAERKARRRPRARKAAPEIAAAEVAEPVQAVPADQPDEQAPAEEVKPKRKPRRTKAEMAQAAEAGAEAAPAPKARRSPARKAAAQPVEADGNTVTEPHAAPREAEASTTVNGTRPAPDQETRTVDGDEAQQDESSDSPRRGWWQRTFGA